MWEWIPFLPTLIEAISKLTSKINTHRPKSGGIHIISYPRSGYRDLGFHVHLDVKWLLRYPNPDPIEEIDLLSSHSPSERVSELDVQGPYCPACETELRQSKRRLPGLGHRWDCDSCGFKINSRISKYETQTRAERVFQSKLMKQLHSKEPRK